ncbi:MAG: dockerin type I repeat-containing protein, partial [Clostridia bacterium]|nr:dockerin type I repeat-containing protein [Clostridia bacterium]
KRHVLRTYTIADMTLADVNGDGEVNAEDYIMLKRACLMTYELPEIPGTLTIELNGRDPGHFRWEDERQVIADGELKFDKFENDEFRYLFGDEELEMVLAKTENGIMLLRFNGEEKNIELAPQA